MTTLELVGIIIVLVYLYGALIGGGLALWKMSKIVDNKSLSAGINKFEMSFMWTFVWPFCLWQWLAHRNDDNIKDE